MFDEETEELADELGLEIALPPRELREHIDSKIDDDRARRTRPGSPAAPNVLGARRRATRSCASWPQRPSSASDLVVQTPYGDSGRTTFFISSEERLG